MYDDTGWFVIHRQRLDNVRSELTSLQQRILHRRLVWRDAAVRERDEAMDRVFAVLSRIPLTREQQNAIFEASIVRSEPSPAPDLTDLLTVNKETT